MSKEKYLEELSDELRISKPMLKRYIHAVGTNKENIKDYAKNGSCAIVRKDNGFDVSYVAQMLNEKDAKIKELEHRLSNCIEPKFKPHNDLFVIVGYKNEPKTVEQYYIDEIVVRGNGTLVEYRDIEKNAIIGQNNTLFTTREQAERYLEELKNANN